MRAPNSSAFDHVRKRQRLPPIQHAPPTNTPSIHVHFPHPTPPQLSITASQSSPTLAIGTTPTNQPTPAADPVIDLTSEAEEPGAIYPTISELLAEVDESMPALGVTRYEGRLLAAGFEYVHQLMDTPTVRTTLGDLEIPAGLVEELIEYAGRMTRRAAKKPAAVKNEGDVKHEHQAN